MDDSFNLLRFVEAQEPVIERVLAELRAGRKQTHWMWFVFPQIAGLGFSAMAQTYAIASRDEAAAYLAHPALRPRLDRCTRLVLDHAGAPIESILGSIDALKFHSSMTLFARSAGGPSLYEEALRVCFNGRADQATIDRLQSNPR